MEPREFVVAARQQSGVSSCRATRRCANQARKVCAAQTWKGNNMDTTTTVIVVIAAVALALYLMRRRGRLTRKL